VILDISDMDTVLEIFVNQEAFFESIIEWWLARGRGQSLALGSEFTLDIPTLT
jgi:hypothetical protein